MVWVGMTKSKKIFIDRATAVQIISMIQNEDNFYINARMTWASFTTGLAALLVSIILVALLLTGNIFQSLNQLAMLANQTNASIMTANTISQTTSSSLLFNLQLLIYAPVGILIYALIVIGGYVAILLTHKRKRKALIAHFIETYELSDDVLGLLNKISIDKP